MQEQIDLELDKFLEEASMNSPKKKTFVSQLPEPLKEDVYIIRKKLIEAEKREFSSLTLTEIISRVLKGRSEKNGKSRLF